MKKSILSIFGAALFAAVLSSCASIPEPSEKDNNLIYGQLEFNFSCIPNNYDIPEKSSEKSGIEVKFRNIKTNKIITMTTNSKGEFYHAGIPEGTYIIYSFKKTIKYGAGRYEADYSAVFDKNKTTNFHFIPVEGTVINLGKISLEISIKDIGYYSWRVDWDKDFEKTKRYFSEHQPNSPWLDKEWITRHESLERHLTLFP